MKKILLLSFFILFSNAFTQGQVWKKTPTGIANNLRAIHFPTKNTGYIAGDYHTILKTTDAGESWRIMMEGSGSVHFRDIYFTDPNTGFAVGSKEIFKTTDGGKNWKKIEPERASDFYCLFFQNATTGFAAGWVDKSFPVIYKTTDAGETWQAYPIQLNGDKSFPVINDVAFINTQIGYAVGDYMTGGSTYALLLKTTDGGKTWKEENPNIIASFVAITFINSTTGFITGDTYRSEPGESGTRGIVLKTTDGGKTWTKQIFPDIFIHSICFPDKQTGYFTSLFSNIYKTTDGGETWKPQTIDGLKGATCIYFTDKETGFVGGMYGEVFKSTPIPVGIEEVEGEADALPPAFPNPARGTVTLPYSLTKQNEGVLKIFNAGGGLMKQVKVTKDEKTVLIGLDGFPAGLYFYSCDDKLGRFTVE